MTHTARRLLSTEVSRDAFKSVMRTNMRSIVIAFLFWHCCSHPMVACTQTESTTSTAGTTHSPGVKSTIAHVNRKESAFVTDERNTVAKTSCSDIDVGQRPAVDTSVVITAKQPVAVNEAKTSIADQNYPDSTATDNVDIRGRSIDSPSPRSCIASRDCASSLHETCAASDAGLVCGCGQGYIRNKQTKTCELAGDVPRRDVEDDADEIDRQSREGTPQEAVSGNTAHADEELSSDDQDPLPASEKIIVEAELPIAIATTGESTDRVPELDDQSVNSISLEARALAVEPPKNLISADSTISMVECPAPWPEQKPKDPAVHSPEKAPLPEEMAARPQDSVEASSSDGTLNTRQESSETITPVAPTDNAQESREPGTLENSQTDSMQELPIASAEVSSSSMSDAPESSVKGSPRPSVSLESDAFAEADFSEQPTESTSESPQDLGPEGLPSSANEVPEAADPQESTDTEDESPEAVFYEKPVTPAIASVGVVIPEMPAVTSAASSTVSIQEEPAIATKGSSEDLDSNNPADFAEETSEAHVSAEETELEDESPCASLPAETEGTSGETSQAVSSEEPGSPSELEQQASDFFESKAVARGAPRALTAASSKCDAVLDSPRSSDANTETESGSERAAEMETIGGNSSEEFKSRGDTPPPLLPATGNSKTRETVH